MKHLSKFAGAAIAASLAMVTTAFSQTVEEFYKDNPVTLVVSASGGGGSDNWARQFAPFLQKHMPGNPQIIVTNQPGASGMTAAINLQAKGKADGSLIAMLQRNNLYLPLISDVEIAFDPPKANWIGSLNKEAYAVMVLSDTGINTPQDLMTKSIKVSATSFANENRVLPAMMNEYYGTKFEIVQGYESSPAMSLALERGEVQGRLVSIDYLMAYGIEKPMLEAGKVKIVLQAAMERHRQFPDVPTVRELTKDPAVLALTDFLLLPMEAGLPFAVPPGVPEDRLAALRKAFIEAANDPEYLEVMGKTGTVPQPISGEEVQKIVGQLYATSKDALDKARVLVNPPR